MSTTKRNWLALMDELKLEPRTWRRHWRALDDLYGDERRHYHTWRHIADVLEKLERFGAGKNVPSVRLAAFYHDAIYDTTRKDNEARSAQLLASFAEEAGIPKQITEDGVALVLSTAGHAAAKGRLESFCRLFVDCDLSILGSSPRTYDLYTRNIRLEYKHIPEMEFCQKRAALLEHFLSRQTLFLTPEIFAAYETRARKNLHRELKKLTST